jgi:hypothetical protein
MTVRPVATLCKLMPLFEASSIPSAQHASAGLGPCARGAAFGTSAGAALRKQQGCEEEERALTGKSRGRRRRSSAIAILRDLAPGGCGMREGVSQGKSSPEEARSRRWKRGAACLPAGCACREAGGSQAASKAAGKAGRQAGSKAASKGGSPARAVHVAEVAGNLV